MSLLIPKMGLRSIILAQQSKSWRGVMSNRQQLRGIWGEYDRRFPLTRYSDTSKCEVKSGETEKLGLETSTHSPSKLTALRLTFECFWKASAGNEPSSRIFFMHSSFCFGWYKTQQLSIRQTEKLMSFLTCVTMDLLFVNVEKIIKLWWVQKLCVKKTQRCQLN